MRLLTVLDRDYPLNLHAVFDRPPFLFVAGQLNETADARSVAVIGSRRAGPEALDLAGLVAAHLTEAGYTVVSGLAAGIDGAAHRAVLARGGRTLAVIGTGHQHAYPAQNAELQQEIAEAGAVFSQFWPDVGPSRHTFPLRNAVMSGITLVTVIVDATARSGARIQARQALAHGRPVVLCERVLAQSWARALAARPGCHVVRTPSALAPLIARLTAPNELLA